MPMKRKFKVVYEKLPNNTWEWTLWSQNTSPIARGYKPYVARWAARRSFLRVMQASKLGVEQIEEVDDGPSADYPFTINRS